MDRSRFNATALDPSRSVVIEACAGSGKTWLLVSRMVRLLLSGAAPGEILAITFTRKAAQEMQARLRDWLRDLALAPDEEVLAFLRERALSEAEAKQVLPRARALFEDYLTAQPGITINTFHGWFLQLLQRAPLQCGAPGTAGLVEKTSTLLEEAWQAFVERLAAAPEGDEARAFDQLLEELGLPATRHLLLGFVGKRAEWWAYTRGARDPVAVACARLREELAVDPEHDPVAALFAEPLTRERFAAYAALLERNTTASDAKLMEKLRQAFEADDPGVKLQLLQEVCFTSTGTPRKREMNAALAKRLGQADAETFLLLHAQLCERLAATQADLTHRTVYRLNRAAFACGTALLGVYQGLKDDRQVQDFGDVEWRLCELLERSDYADYMQYKLDARYRHVLLDEFQDTNPLQWRAMKAWLAASAAAGSRPSVFMVGDPKQSIYRFRRAEPRLFGIAADFLEAEFDAARLRQNTSRRCAPAVLGAVNAVFTPEPAFTGFEPHAAHDDSLPGDVACVPPKIVEAEPPSIVAGLRNPLLTSRPVEEDLRHRHEGQLVAETLSRLVGRLSVADGADARPLQYSDVMLLVRRRTHVEAYEAALKQARIPYVSTRRGGLLDTLECSDLSALLEFLSVPFADLRLAQVLRSPLFGASDRDLMALAATGTGSWWRRLRQLAAGPDLSPTLARAAALLEAWLQAADRLPVHDLLDRIYFEGDLIARYAAAVPETQRPAVTANLHAFMELALAVDSGRYPSLGKFLDELAALSGADDQEAPDEAVIGDIGNAVRIHTIHEAKGLEASLVWVLDANGTPRSDTGARVIVDWPPEAESPRHFSVLLGSRLCAAPQARALDAERPQAEREDFNLLYVAMTRARQYLLASACEGGRSGGWYDKLAVAAPPGPDPVLAAACRDWPGTAAAAPPRPPEVDPRLRNPLPTGHRQPPGVTSQAIDFGTTVHLLLEALSPPSAVVDKPALRLRSPLSDADFEQAWQHALTLLAAPALRAFFDPQAYRRAWNELPYRRPGGEYRRIDRVVDRSDGIWVLDYKTGAAAGASLRSRAAPYREQMGEYRNAMRHVFPGKTVRCLLVFGPEEVYEVPADQPEA